MWIIKLCIEDIVATQYLHHTFFTTCDIPHVVLHFNLYLHPNLHIDKM